MIRILLLAFFVFSLVSTAEVTLDQLKWQPNLITKESILADYEEFTPKAPPLFTNITQLVYITDWSERGYYFAEMNAKRINYVSFAWFTVVPKFNEYKKMIDVEVQDVEVNEDKPNKPWMDQDYFQRLRKRNPDIKIVPRFEFTNFSPDVIKSFVQTEWLVQRSAQTIANFCREHGFDGAVIKCLTPLSKGVFFDERVFENKLHAVNLYRDMLETLEQVGNVIRRNELIAIFTMQSPVTLNNMEDEKKFYLLPAEFSHKMMNAYDFVHISYSETELMNRQYVHDRFLEEIMKSFNYSSKLLVGINFFGREFPLHEYRKSGNGKNWKIIEFKRFLEVLRKDDAVLTFNEVNKEHELTSRWANAFIIFPSLTQLEYCLAHVKQHPGVGIAIWEYGQGLDYFANLV